MEALVTDGAQIALIGEVESRRDAVVARRIEFSDRDSTLQRPNWLN